MAQDGKGKDGALVKMTKGSSIRRSTDENLFRCYVQLCAIKNNASLQVIQCFDDLAFHWTY